MDKETIIDEVIKEVDEKMGTEFFKQLNDSYFIKYEKKNGESLLEAEGTQIQLAYALYEMFIELMGEGFDSLLIENMLNAAKQYKESEGKINE